MGIVEELREVAHELSEDQHLRGGVPTRCFIYKRITGIGIDNCTDAIFCAECAVLYLNTLANRIEDEYGNGKA